MLFRKILTAIVILFIIFASPVMGIAKGVSHSKAKLVAQNWIHHLTKRHDSSGYPPLQAGMKIIDEEIITYRNAVVGYNFILSPEGHILVPFSDELPPVKLYSDTSTLRMSDNADVAEWIKEELFSTHEALESHKKELEGIDFSNTHNGRLWALFGANTSSFLAQYDMATGGMVFLSLGPLLSTTWDQGDPYNLHCPQWYTGERTVTGCVATAAAQIMKYWSFPAAGKGSTSYTWYNGSQNVTLSRDFSQSTYNWSLMKNSYGSGNPPEEKEAVANLMADVGIAFHMNYGIASQGGSGASSTIAASALLQFFGYKPRIKAVSRRNYADDSAWMKVFRNEVQNKRPSLFSIWTSTVGHEVVVDGYRSSPSEQIHISLGWSGSYDGWYVSNNIQAGGYNFNDVQHQDAVIGIEPSNRMMDSVTAGYEHTLGVKSDGTLWGWGSNTAGQLGDGTTTDKHKPALSYVKWVTVAGGYDHNVGLKSDGTLWAWGSNYYGQLGDGTTTDRHAPVQIGSDNNWVGVRAGRYHTVALKSDGTLWAWGSNYYGQLGDGTFTDKHLPVQIGTGNNWSTIALGSHHTIGLKSDGTLWGWGFNLYGQLGDGTNTSRGAPVQIGTDTDWSTVAAGTGHTIGLKSDGTLWGWGLNSYGQLGDGTSTHRYAPVQIGNDKNWVAIGTGDNHTVGLKRDGTLWAWGYNYYGQLGDGTATDRHAPVQIGSGNNWGAIAAGSYHTVALKGDGTLWAWGYNYYGQLGDGTTTDRHAPLQIGTDTHWSTVAAGTGHTIGLKSDGTLWGWGLNNYGQLGDATTADRHAPVQIGTDTDWSSVAGGTGHTIGLKSDGTLWGWGYNYYGQLGDGTATDRHAPVQIGSGSNWGAIAPGSYHTVALKWDGTLWGWGLNNCGQLGDGTTEDRHAPAQIGTDADWSTVAGGTGHTIGLKSDGTLWGWGLNSYGQLGDGTVTNRLSPVQIGADTNWSAVAAGCGHTVGLKSDGTLWAWGYNYYGQLGDGTATDRHAPVQIGSDNNWISIAAESSHTIGLKSDGTVWAWGLNDKGQLGDGTTTNRNVPTQIFLVMGGSDFNGDNKPDIIWRNTSTGRTTIWYMNGATWSGGYADIFPTVTDPNWTIVGVADFNGDYKPDLLWRNSVTGQTTVWYMDGAAWNGGYADVIPMVSDPDWQIVGICDFNNDGNPDILWRNKSTYRTTIWYMNGTTWNGGYADVIPTVSDPNWAIVGVADFNNDTKPDIVWRNTATGRTAIWYMDGAKWNGGYADLLPTVSDPDWQIVAIRDFNGDGNPDVLWRNKSTYRTTIWYMNGATWNGGYGDLVPRVSDPNWTIVGR